MVIEQPIAGVALGVDPKSTVIVAEIKAGVELLESQVDDRTAPSMVTTANYGDLASQLLAGLADSLSDANGVWSGVGGFSGAVPVLDSAAGHFTSGTASVAMNLAHPSNAASAVRMSFDLTTAVPVGAHTEAEFDIRWSLENGVLTHANYELVIASGPLLTGTLAVLSLTDALLPTTDTWYTVRVPVGAVTSIKSYGIRRKSGTTTGSSSRRVTWNLDRPNLAPNTALDVALSQLNRHVTVTPDYITANVQALRMLGASQGLTNLVPGKETVARFRGEQSVMDSSLEQGVARSVHTDLQRILSSLQPFDSLHFPPNGIYRVDGELVCSVPFVRIHANGSRFVQYVEHNEPMWNLQADGVELYGARIFGRNGIVATPAGSALVTTAGTPTISGSTRVLTTLGDEVRVPVKAGNAKTDNYARDHLGYIQFDLTLSQATPVANDVVVTVLDATGTKVMYTQTLTVTSTPTAYPIRFIPYDLFERTQIRVKKATTGNPFTIHSYKTYFGVDYDANMPFNHGIACRGPHQIIEDCWVEGMTGDGLNIRGDLNSGSRIRRFFSRACGRQGISWTQGSDTWIDQAVVLASGRHTFDVEPETDSSHMSHGKLTNCIFGVGIEGGFTASGGSRMDNMQLKNIVQIADQGPAFDCAVEDSHIENIVYRWTGTGTPDTLKLSAKGIKAKTIDSDGRITVSGPDVILRDAIVNKVDQTGSLVWTGARGYFDDVTIGDETVVTIDTALLFNPVQLYVNPADHTQDTLYGSIRVPLWRTEFGNTFKSAVANGSPWWPHGLDLRSGGVRSMRGLSSSSTPANQLAGSVAVANGATTRAIDFPVRTDVLQPADFTLAASGPHVTHLKAEDNPGLVGTWTMTYNGQTTAALDVFATKAQVQAALWALSTIADGEVTVAGDHYLSWPGGSGGFDLTWAATLGDTPDTLFSTTSLIFDYKSHLIPIDVDTITVGGFMAPGTYWYRLAGRTFEGQPLAARAAKTIVLSGNNAVKITTPVPGYSQVSDRKVEGVTIWRTDVGGVAAGPYVVRYDVVGATDFGHPSGGVDRGTNLSGFSPQVVNIMGTELDKDQSGWEKNALYHLDVSPSWPTSVGVVKRADGSGADLTFGTAAPGSGSPSLTWGLQRYG